MSSKFDTWFNNVWTPKARKLTHELATISRFMGKNRVTGETVDAINDKIVELRTSMNDMQKELSSLELKKVL